MIHAGPPAWRLSWWRWKTGRGYRRWALFVAVLVVIGAFAWDRARDSALFTPTVLVRSQCLPYQARIPASWRAVPTSQRSAECNMDTGREILVARWHTEQIVLAIRAETIESVAALATLSGTDSRSRTGIRYTLLTASNGNPIAMLHPRGLMYTVRCQTGSPNACRHAIGTLLDGLQFFGGGT
jgi:hypothetical protein